MTNDIFVFLDAWDIVVAGGGSVLQGLVTGHPNVPGRRRPIRTSRLLWISPDWKQAETLNTTYSLGRRLDALIRDEWGEPQFVALGGLIASRNLGTDWWNLAKGDDILAAFDTGHLMDVLNRMLDIDRPLEDLIAEIEPHMLH